MADKLNLYKGNELVKSEEKSEGKTTITITGLESNTKYPKGTYQVAFSNESGESDKVDVPEFQTKAVGVTSVTLDKETLNLDTEATDVLTATVSPEDADNKNVTFESSDDNVATVDESGNVLGVSPGTATITVTTEDGKQQATCEVTVKDPIPEAPENVTVEPSETTADISV